MKKCKRCKEKVLSQEYDTGLEYYCKCQTTLDTDFDETLWEENNG